MKTSQSSAFGFKLAVGGVLLGAALHTMAVTVVTPVTLTEEMDWVLSDTYYDGPGPQPVPEPAWPAWPVVRIDVTNNSVPLGVYGLFVGAQPGPWYDWSESSAPAMAFGIPWAPLGFDFENPTYLPQQENGDSTIDWGTEVLGVRHTAVGPVISVYDSVAGLDVAFKLPEEFSTYDYVYRFATTGPFTACTGDDCGDSVPIPLGQTFPYYVTGGLASPMVYLEQADFRSDGSLAVTYNGGIPAAVPEPAAGVLLVSGLALLSAWRRRQIGAVAR